MLFGGLSARRPVVNKLIDRNVRACFDAVPEHPGECLPVIPVAGSDLEPFRYLCLELLGAPVRKG